MSRHRQPSEERRPFERPDSGWCALETRDAWPAAVAGFSVYYASHDGHGPMGGPGWPRALAVQDLRWWVDRVRMGHEKRFPGRPALMERWGWKDNAVRKLLDEIDPLGLQVDASGAPAARQRSASAAPAPDAKHEEEPMTGASAAPAPRQSDASGDPQRVVIQTPDTRPQTQTPSLSPGSGERGDGGFDPRPWAAAWKAAWEADGRGKYPWDHDKQRVELHGDGNRLLRIAKAAESIEDASAAFRRFLSAHRSSSPPWPPHESPTLLKFCKKLGDHFATVLPPEREREPGEENEEDLDVPGEIRLEQAPGGWRIWNGAIELTQHGDVSGRLAVELLDMLVENGGLDPPTRDRLVETILAHTHPEAAK